MPKTEKGPVKRPGPYSRGSKQDDSGEDNSGAATKKFRVPKGAIRILSANTLGMTTGKMDKLVTMADDNEINLIVLQEGVSNIHEYQPDGWTAFVTHEAPTTEQLTVGQQKATPSTGTNRYYNTFVRDDSGLTVTVLPYEPSSSQAFCDRVCPPATTSRSGRVTQKPVDQAVLSMAGLRPPQVLQVSSDGHQSVTIYNFHAPQGGGSAKGFSGRDAPLGHEMLSYVLNADPTPNKMVIGDQNANLNSMRKLYPTFDVISAGSKDPLTHSASSKGLKAEPINLNGAGDAFNSKGTKDCSDHSAMAVNVTLPKTL